MFEASHDPLSRRRPFEPPHDRLREPLLTTKEAARYLRVSHRTMEGWRHKGGGPEFRRLPSGQVRYTYASLNEWAGRLRHNTSDR